jgi:putative membrane protein
MKTTIKNYLFAAPLMVLLWLAACNGNRKNSSEVADSANQKFIAKADSANKVQEHKDDSALRANKDVMKDASKFLVKWYESGMYELQLSQLAATNALDADVKNLAVTFVNDHKAINTKIESIASHNNFVLPTSVNADHQRDLRDITKLTGADFDKKYVNTIISAHDESVDSYKNAYKNLAAGDTKTFAGQALPAIEDHLTMAKKVAGRIQ